MRLGIFTKNSRIPRWFVVILAILWFSAIPLMNCAPIIEPLPHFIGGVSAVLMTLIFLRIGNYFHLLRPIPRQSDLFVMIAAVAIASLFLTTIDVWIYGVSACRLSAPIMWSPVLGILAFMAHYSISRYVAPCLSKMRIVLDLDPVERNLVIAELEALAISDRFVFLSRGGLTQYLLRGAHADIDLIVISRQNSKHFEADSTLLRAHLLGIPICERRQVTTALTGRIRLADSDFESYLLEAVPQTPTLRAFWRTKETIEPLIAGVLALLLAPLMGCIAALIKLSSNGPVFYKQIRTGYMGRPFTLIKFRSMRIDAEKDGPRWCSSDDRRVTRLGRILRRTRLDELPQLFNVIRGDMGFFGPRPERPEIYSALRREIPVFSIRTVVKPGITGWAQVLAGYASSVEESRKKLEYDLFYIQNMSPRLDLIALLLTIKIAIFGHGEERTGVTDTRDAATKTEPTPAAASSVLAQNG